MKREETYSKLVLPVKAITWWHSIFKALVDVNAEVVNFTWDKHSLQCSHTFLQLGLLQIQLPHQDTEDYEIVGRLSGFIGVNVKAVFSIFKSLLKKQDLKIEFVSETSFGVYNEDVNATVKHMNLDVASLDPTELVDRWEFVVPSSSFRDALPLFKALNIETITFFKGLVEPLTIFSDEHADSVVKTKIVAEVTKLCNKVHKSSYALKYIDLMGHLCQLVERFDLILSAGPIFFRFDLPGHGSIVVYLAPKITEEEM